MQEPVYILSKSGNHNAVVRYSKPLTTGEVLKHLRAQGFYYDQKGNAIPFEEIEYIRIATEEEYQAGC
jgi:hypothetical protein